MPMRLIDAELVSDAAQAARFQSLNAIRLKLPDDDDNVALASSTTLATNSVQLGIFFINLSPKIVSFFCFV